NQRLFYDPDEFPLYIGAGGWLLASLSTCGVFTCLCRAPLGAGMVRMETSGRRNLYWWDGEPGRNQPNREYKGPLLGDLSALFK
ncbi:hypothetical protein PHMEG_00012694, partial [Phytophthora megakarya]